jgi:hypothetical protein
MLKKPTPIDAAIAALRSAPQSPEVDGLVAREQEIRERIAALNAARAEAARDAHAVDPGARARAYLAGTVTDGPAARVAEIDRELGLARAALDVLRVDLVGARARAADQLVKTAKLDEAAASSRAAVAAAAQALVAALDVAEELSDAAEARDVSLAGALWTGYAPGERPAIARLAVECIGRGPLHPHERARLETLAGLRVA